MTKQDLSETERIQSQPTEVWLDDLEGIQSKNTDTQSGITNSLPEMKGERRKKFIERVKKAGIISVRMIDDKLLITTNRYIDKELNHRIKKSIHHLSIIAYPDTREPLYVYAGYRTILSNGRPHLVVEFTELYTGEMAERYFNIILKNKKGKYFKTKHNGEFRIKGRYGRATKGTFIKLWKDAVKHLPDNKSCNIYRHMNPMLSGAVFSCANTKPHHDIIKLKDVIFSGYLYPII